MIRSTVITVRRDNPVPPNGPALSCRPPVNVPGRIGRPPPRRLRSPIQPRCGRQLGGPAGHPAVAGQPFSLLLDITSEGPAFTGTLLNLLYVSATPIVVGYLPGVPFAVDLSVTDAPLLSVPSYPALPPHLYLLLLFDNATSDLVAYAFEVVG